MSEGGSGALRQRLGRRLGLEPYYEVAERGPGRLRLESRPGANRRPGLAILGTGIVMLVVGAVLVVSGALAGTGGAGFGVMALSAVVGGLLAGLGFQRAAGGYAVLTTRNTVEADAGAGELRFAQVNRLAGERRQALPYAAISGLRLRRRPLATGLLLKRVRPIVALELLAGDELWVVDSASGAEELRPAAEGLVEALGVELGQEPVAGRQAAGER